MDNIDIVTIIRQTECGRGYVCETPSGKNCYVNSEVIIKHDLREGDALVGALVPHRNPYECELFAEWVLPEQYVTLDEVYDAKHDLDQGGLILARDLGIHAGDILHHAGYAYKVVGFGKGKSIDPGMHIAYTNNLDATMNEVTVEYYD